MSTANSNNPWFKNANVPAPSDTPIESSTFPPTHKPIVFGALPSADEVMPMPTKPVKSPTINKPISSPAPVIAPVAPTLAERKAKAFAPVKKHGWIWFFGSIVIMIIGFATNQTVYDYDGYGHDNGSVTTALTICGVWLFILFIHWMSVSGQFATPKQKRNAKIAGVGLLAVLGAIAYVALKSSSSSSSSTTSYRPSTSSGGSGGGPKPASSGSSSGSNAGRVASAVAASAAAAQQADQQRRAQQQAQDRQNQMFMAQRQAQEEAQRQAQQEAQWQADMARQRQGDIDEARNRWG